MDAITLLKSDHKTVNELTRRQSAVVKPAGHDTPVPPRPQ
jgi:hypothetical protein